MAELSVNPQQWERGPKIVAVGGGTGLSTMLRGLKKYTKNLTAVVTVADDGGGSGMLRRDIGMPPPGDIRHCMEALANTEPIMQKLLTYRFTEGSLAGQSFGNLILAALNGVTGSFEEAVSQMSQVLAITGQVIPVTSANVQLEAVFENGVRVVGESKIYHVKKEQDCRIAHVALIPEHPAPLPAALAAIREADLILLGLCCAASVFGIAMIYSATRYNNDNRKIIVQTAALLIGIVVYFGISMIDLEMLIKRWKWIAAFDVLFILLLKTPFGVSDDTGNTAWLKFPFLPVSIGPAEVVKITFIILLAWQLQWLREEKRDLRSFSAAFYVGGHTLGIAGLYFVISGDMGNALMFLLIFVVMSFVAGFALRWFALLFGASGAVIGGIIAFDLVPDSKKYMLNRFIVLFDHSYDVQHTGWQQTRSLLTIGGGGFWGQGYLHGTQSQAGVGSVPARHTDLIFAVIGEELGFVGATLSILLLVAIIIRVLVVGRRATQPFHTYVCVGIASMVMFQMIINIGMCLFLMPVIGLTLPFFSYGGSSVVTLFAAMGFVSGIKKRTVVRRRPGRPLGSNAVY